MAMARLFFLMLVLATGFAKASATPAKPGEITIYEYTGLFVETNNDIPEPPQNTDGCPDDCPVDPALIGCQQWCPEGVLISAHRAARQAQTPLRSPYA